MTVDLILLCSDENIPRPNWPLGQVRIIPPMIGSLNELLDSPLTATDALLFWDSALSLPDPQLIEHILSGPADLWHAGLVLGMGGLPRSIDYVTPTWMLNCDPPADIEATSWRVSLKACLVRVDVLRQMGFLRPGFHSLDAAALEWGHRCIRLGVVMRHIPSLVDGQGSAVLPPLNFEDELRFVRLRFGFKWQVWASWRAVLSGEVKTGNVVKANRVLMKESHLNDSVPFQRDVIPVNAPKGDKVSVLIPTIDRYPYLEKVLSQLGTQTHPPHEIIVIDQTPLKIRDTDIYAKFPDLPLQVVFLEQPGQCASRNAGLDIASGDYVLFIDDDDEIPHDLIGAHLWHLHERRAAVSSGVAHEVGAGTLPKDFTYPRVSDVFPTNNTLIYRALLSHSGLFDLAYDHGARADADLGMRIYLSGVLMLLNPEIDVLHHRAARGGLRTHKARVITYAKSRSHLLHRHIPPATEIYLAHRYFHPRQVCEMCWLAVFSSFSLFGPNWLRVLKIFASFALLPDTLVKLFRNVRSARLLMQQHPTIPLLQRPGVPE